MDFLNLLSQYRTPAGDVFFQGITLLAHGSLTVEYRKKPYEAYKKALFLSILLNLLVLVCARYDIIKRKEVFYVYKYHW